MSDKFQISHDYLAKLAGKAAFSRGMDYYKSGNVLSIKQNANRITADVDGTEIYRVTLKWTRTQLEGACDCPASEGFDFCKHCVAVALSLQADQAQQDNLLQGGELNRIKAYLLKQDKEKLADWLLELIKSEKPLLQEWSLRADNALGLLDAKAIRKRITAAIPYNRHLYRYNQVRSYFAQIETFVDQLQEMIENLPADDALKLIDYALQRIYRALETIDDSGGFRYYAVEELQNMHITTCARLDWKPKKLSNYLLGLAFGDYVDLYPAIPSSYLETLGEEGDQLFYENVRQRWDELPALAQDSDFDSKYQYMKLQFMLEEAARHAGDEKAIISLREKTATELYDYQDLAERCLAIGDYNATEQWLDKCRKYSRRKHSSHKHINPAHDFRTEHIQIKLYTAQGLWSDALKLQWTIYSQDYQTNDFKTLLKFAQKSGDKTDWLKKAEQILKQQLQKKSEQHWSHVWADRLVELYILNKLPAKALAIAKKEKINQELLLDIAWNTKDNPDDAFPLFKRVIEFSVNQGNNDAYHYAIDILKQMAEKLKSKQHRQLLSELITHLRKTFRAKRNFIKWLNEAFAL